MKQPHLVAALDGSTQLKKKRLTNEPFFFVCAQPGRWLERAPSWLTRLGMSTRWLNLGQLVRSSPRRLAIHSRLPYSLYQI